MGKIDLMGFLGRFQTLGVWGNGKMSGVMDLTKLIEKGLLAFMLGIVLPGALLFAVMVHVWITHPERQWNFWLKVGTVAEAVKYLFQRRDSRR